MPKAGNFSFYAVARGHVPGVYSTWDECQQQVSGFAGNKHQRFSTLEQARTYLSQHGVTSDDSSNAAITLATSVPSVSRTHRGSKPYERNATKSKGEERTPGFGSSRWAALTTEVIADETGWDVVYSDGACKGNGKVGSVAGVGVWWGRDDARNIAERCPGGQTNNRAELIAIVRVLQTTPHTKKPLLIKTDSKYSISCFREWMPKWLRNNFKSSSGELVKNAPLIRYLSALLDQRAREGQKVHLQYVKGHAGEEGNEGADWLANQGACLPQQLEREWDTLIDRLEDVTDQLSVQREVPPTSRLPQAELEAYTTGLADDDELLSEIAAAG